ncbi:MAG TPA: hypothetical protein VMU13_03395 [Candidatus Paceibacterota bacterium]|nr:hypothetical protein [Candidatus Paceibacterota bacterium]
MSEEGATPARIKWNEVTWYSRMCAIILFVGVVPALSFYIGMQYELIVRQTPATPIQSTQSTPNVQPSFSTSTSTSPGSWVAFYVMTYDDNPNASTYRISPTRIITRPGVALDFRGDEGDTRGDTQSMQYVVDFGDGSSQILQTQLIPRSCLQTLVPGDCAPYYGIDIKHAYNAPGTYTAQLLKGSVVVGTSGIVVQ